VSDTNSDGRAGAAAAAPEPKYDYELIVIGGGPAGEKGAAQAAYFGHKTVLIEEYKELGGACINWGTLASKTLRESSLFLSGFRTRQLGQGLNVEFRADITLDSFMYRKNQVQDAEQKRARENLAKPWHKIERLYGRGTLKDAHSVSLKKPDGSEQTITGKFILIATGSVPARPPSLPFNDRNVFDSTTVLEMRKVPRSMTVIGGGVIGSEYACLFQALGVQVTLVHPKGRALDSLLDAEIGEEFMTRMRAAGIKPEMNSTLASAAVEGDNVRLRLKGKDGAEKEVLTESLLYALGRSGNTKGLGLEALGIPTAKYGHIEKVDPITYQTTVPNIYAAGDVIGPPALASTSMEQGRLAMCHAFDIHYKTRLNPILPAGIYTIPEISQVGRTEEDCKREGIPYVVGKDRYGHHGRGQIIGDTEGMIKLIFAAPSGKLLGVHVIGEIASELVHIGQACLQFGGDIDFFIHTVFNYPTLSDVYKYAAYHALGKLNQVRDATEKAAREAVNLAAVTDGKPTDLNQDKPLAASGPVRAMATGAR
jgi:NAD(P) transhydrogenase